MTLEGRTVRRAEVHLAMALAMDRCFEDSPPLANLTPKLVVIDLGPRLALSRPRRGAILVGRGGRLWDGKETVLALDGDGGLLLALGPQELERHLAQPTFTPVGLGDLGPGAPAENHVGKVELGLVLLDTLGEPGDDGRLEQLIEGAGRRSRGERTLLIVRALFM